MIFVSNLVKKDIKMDKINEFNFFKRFQNLQISSFFMNFVLKTEQKIIKELH